MVLGALDGEIEGDLQSMVRSRRHQSTKIFATTQLRMNRLMPALFTADRIGAARIVRSGGQRVVGALAITATDRVDWREIQHVEAHVLDHRQP
ncbi:hypothetical protein D3C76_1303400 [compost metagenome]